MDKHEWKRRQAQYTIVPCPKCGAEVDRYCRTSERSKKGTNGIRSAHVERQVAALQIKYGIVSQ